MHDFAQAGPICTLPRLNDTYGAQLEASLGAHAQQRPVSLIIPCHGMDLRQPALAHILAELAPATWLREVVLSVNGARPMELEHGQRLAAALPCPTRVLENDAPAQAEEYGRAWGVERVPQGKGLNVWAAVRLVQAEGRSSFVALQDADVSSFRRENLARLVAACVDPRLGFRFAKMYYARVTDRLYGRVTRLFFTPLLEALQHRVGSHGLLEFLSAFRYALAGECVCEIGLAERLAYHPGWGLETKMLAQVYRHTGGREVCQVDGGTGYHHRHHAVSGHAGLGEMCGVIAETLFAELESAGFSQAGTMLQAAIEEYPYAAERHRQRSSAVSIMNGLPADEAGDRAMIQEFAAVLKSMAPQEQ